MMAYSVEDLIYILFEATCYANTWEDALLCIFMLDVEAAFDSVRHADVMDHFQGAGASAHQLLALGRSMEGNVVTLEIPDVVAYDPMPMTKALKTGGKTGPDKFVLMFEALVDACLTD